MKFETLEANPGEHRSGTPVIGTQEPMVWTKRYGFPIGHGTVAAFRYGPHIRRIELEKLDSDGVKRYPARRWVTQRTLAWLSNFRAILMRYDPSQTNYLGLLQLACSTSTWYRRQRNLANSEIVTKTLQSPDTSTEYTHSRTTASDPTTSTPPV